MFGFLVFSISPNVQEKKAKGNKLPENKAKAFNTLRSKAGWNGRFDIFSCQACSILSHLYNIFIYIWYIYIWYIYIYIYGHMYIYIYTYFIYPYISCYEVMRCSASLWHAWIFFPRFIHLQRFFCCFFILFQQSGRGRSPSATRGQRQVKKGNKPYTDDLTQLRAKPEDFQSEEEEVDSASEVGMGKKGGWFWHIS